MKTQQPGYQHFTDRRWFIRLMEIVPGMASWSLLIGPIVLSLFYPIAVAYFIIAFDLYWLGKALRMSTFLLRGYGRMRATMALNWTNRVDWLIAPKDHLKRAEQRMRELQKAHPTAHRRFQLSRKGRNAHLRYRQLAGDINLLRDFEDRHNSILNPRDVYHLVIIATYNETREILEPTVQGVLDSHYPSDRIMLVIAYEERGGEEIAALSKDLVATYGADFAHAEAIKHPDNIPGELRGKGGNITFAGRKMAAEIEARGIDPEHVVVTTLDADNKPHKYYFAHLTYTYALDPNRIHKSYQPAPLFLNNIWDAPAPTRIVATGNTFFQLMEMMRPHRLRNFSSHAQPLRALIETDFWSVTSPVEDGHQFWRSYFTFNGDYAVVPLYIPIYQDAVMASNYPKTLVAQYKQLRRWAYGVSDFQYVIRNSIRNKQISLGSKIVQSWRLFEGHVSWATGVLIITFVAWLPLFLNERFSQQELAHQLPIIASRVQTVAMLGLFVMVAISLIMLPPRPKRYGRHRFLFMMLQWILLPVTGIFFHSFAAIDAQTRLMFGRYLGFYVTAKTRKS